MLTISHVIILLVFIALGSAGIAAMQEGISVVFKHFTRNMELKTPAFPKISSRSPRTAGQPHYR